MHKTQHPGSSVPALLQYMLVLPICCIADSRGAMSGTRQSALDMSLAQHACVQFPEAVLHAMLHSFAL